MKYDKEVVIAALSHGANWEEVPQRLKNKKDVVLAAVNENGGIVGKLSKKFQSDVEVLMAALKTNSDIIWHFCEHDPDNAVYVAARYGLRWDDGWEIILDCFPDQLSKFDEDTNLCPFMLIASSSRFPQDSSQQETDEKKENFGPFNEKSHLYECDRPFAIFDPLKFEYPSSPHLDTLFNVLKLSPDLVKSYDGLDMNRKKEAADDDHDTLFCCLGKK